MESTLLPTAPSLPVAPYLGGKRNLARRIVARLRRIPHTTYVEPFVGMGGVFLRRDFRASAEVIGDANREIATLFRVLQHHYEAFLEMLRWQLTSRAEFERLRAADPDTLTDLHRAARFLYLQRTAFGGKVADQTFGVSRGLPARFDVARLAAQLADVHERLTSVVIECLPYDRLIPRYDGEGTLFYLDPPYWGCEQDYGAGLFARADFERLAEMLAGLQGRFLLSLNDRPEVRRVFARFEIEAIETTYTVGPAGKGREVLISDRKAP